jgi:hypothetical protein
VPVTEPGRQQLDESLGIHAQQHTLGPPTYAELRAFASVSWTGPGMKGENARHA